MFNNSSATPVRKESPKAVATKERIYETALRLFVEKGFEKTTMRMIAEKAGHALGGTYYYFRSKDMIVLEFYQRSQKRLVAKAQEICADTQDLEQRIQRLIAGHIETHRPYRALAIVLARMASDPTHSLSPFSRQTKTIRKKSVEVFAHALRDSTTKTPADVKPYLPLLFWLYQMGIIFYWIYDSSPQQRNTLTLLNKSLVLLFKLMRLSNFPVLRSFRKGLVQLLESLHTSEVRL
jgi:AcrR family transcriptional regulator